MPEFDFQRAAKRSPGEMDMMVDIADEISNSSLFNGLPAEQVEELARICQDQKYEKGRELFSEGSEAKGFYLVISGKFKIYKLSLEGKEQILHIFGGGEVIGEVPVFAGGSYPANAEAIEPSRALFFPKSSFVELIGREPAIALNLLGILAQRLRRFTHLIEDLSLKEVPARLAAYLDLSGRKGRKQPNARTRYNKDATGKPAWDNPGDAFSNPGENGPAGDHLC